MNNPIPTKQEVENQIALLASSVESFVDTGKILTKKIRTLSSNLEKYQSVAKVRKKIKLARLKFQSGNIKTKIHKLKTKKVRK